MFYNVYRYEINLLKLSGGFKADVDAICGVCMKLNRLELLKPVTGFHLAVDRRSFRGFSH